MTGHTPTGTVHIEDNPDSPGQRVAVATLVCSCGHTAVSQHAYLSEGDETVAETAAWDAMAAHLGHDPRDTETGPEAAD